MALVEILDVQPAAPNRARLRGFALDAPRAGATTEVYRVDLAGWVLGTQMPVVAVEVHAGGGVMRRVPLDRPRPDVAAAYPDAVGGEHCGFRAWLGVVGLEPEFELQVRAVFEDERRVRLGTIRARHQPLRTGFEPTMQPLMLTSLGRAGTTWTMRLLAEHPQIVAHRFHPYELRAFRYWLHMARVLSEPADPYRSAHADRFQTEKSWVGHNPFYPEPVGVTPGLEEWFGRNYVEGLMAFGQQCAEECYTRIAASQGQPGARYFAEKHRPDYLPSLVWELYPLAREIFLVRDFRDVVTSMQAFNTKQGRIVFGNGRERSQEEFARFIRNGPVRMLSQSWPKRRDRAHLVRYEDLIRDPKATLRPLLEYLDLENDDATVDGMIERAREETSDATRHRTSGGGAEGSIGRWREGTDPALQAAYREIFGDVLEQFGYAP